MGLSSATSGSFLPSELIDTIIDSLAVHYPGKALTSTSLVSSEWLRRSRYHSFSTNTLRPTDVLPFVALAAAKHSTLGKCIQSVTLDAGCGSPCQEDNLSDRSLDEFVQNLRLLTDKSSNVNITSLGFSNADWTSFPPNILSRMRHHLSTSLFRPTLQCLSFDSVTFHDLREAVSTAALFPNISRLVMARVSFLKYRDQTCRDAGKLPWIASLREVGVDGKDGVDAVAAVLSWLVAAYDRKDDIRIERLSIKGIRPDDLSVVRAALKRARPSLRRLTLGFAACSEGGTLKGLKLSKMPQLGHLSIEGLCYPCTGSVNTAIADIGEDVVAKALPDVLSALESPFLRCIDLGFVCGPEVQRADVDWSKLQRTLQELCFFGVNHINIDISSGSKGDGDGLEAAKSHLLHGLCDLHTKGIVHVNFES
ncbi:hypothetical protein BKA70DRAFT_1218435 [Coprinopsis sp. MPI-PUGE-AT-0042]|nr:hypothetical protein BKA70DRAFT_1218435 [Coprinopsis sp. MPI-PUGE-AT-0042]